MNVIEELIENADDALLQLYDKLKVAVPGFQSMDIGYMTVPGQGKVPQWAFHTSTDCKLGYDIESLMKHIQSKRWKKHWGTL